MLDGFEFIALNKAGDEVEQLIIFLEDWHPYIVIVVANMQLEGHKILYIIGSLDTFIIPYKNCFLVELS